MNSIILPSLALFNFPMEAGHLIAVVAIVMPFLMIIFVQVAKVIGRTQQEKMRLEVMRVAIERGQPIPAEALRPTPDEDPAGAENALKFHAQISAGSAGAQWNSSRNDIRSGLICIGVGAGLFMMFEALNGGHFGPLEGARWIGAIPGFIGVALLINGLIQRNGPAPRISASSQTPSAGDIPKSGS